MSLTDIDSYYIKCITSLHSEEHLKTKEPSYLQLKLEEAIKNKTGIVKDLTALIAVSNNRPQEEIRSSTHCIEENKTTSSSDNELELDLFNEDLMCIICNGMDVAARNRLLECFECHSLYHQECHRPPVTFEPDSTWTCQNCKETSKKIKKSTPGSSPSHAASSTQSSNIKSIKNSPPHLHRPSTNNSSGNVKLSAVTIPKSSSSSSSSSFKTSTKSGSSQSSSKNTVTPNMLSADKRLQIMKKKAAKLQEKRKQLSR